MNNKRYEKPAMKFVSLRNEETIANTCWGYHGTDTKLYCDIPGEGWTSFQIGGKNCTLNLINVKYYTKNNSDGIVITNSDEEYQKLWNILHNSGGESGNPYSGEGTIVIPDRPNEKWS